MKYLVVLLALVAKMSYADLDSGNYVGIDSEGRSCEISVGVVTFENGAKHPLNERVSVIVNQLEWKLSHPKVLNEQESKVRFNHNLFEGLVTTTRDLRFGAQYLKMTIDHDAKPHRPTEYLYINDDYRDASKSFKIECKNLVKI